MKIKKIFKILSTISLLLPFSVLAQNSALEKLKKVGPDSGYIDVDANSTYEKIGAIVSIFLSILGIIFIILMLYGGYNWMIAGGDESKIETAKKTIRNAIIGLILVLSSYAIWVFISKYLV